MWLSLFACGGPALPDPSDPPILIGGGVSGLATAIQAGEATVLEAADTIGGRAPPAGNILLFVDTPEQAAAGVDDDVAAAVADWPALTGGPPTEATELFLSDSGGIRDWLTSLGVVFALFEPDPIVHHRRFHQVSPDGAGIGDALGAALPPGVEVRTGARVASIDIVDGRVAGVVMEDGSLVPGDTVVIASGGFIEDPDRLPDVVGDVGGLWSAIDAASGEGDALGWADAGGWRTVGLDRIGWYWGTIGIAGASGEPIPIRVDLAADPPTVPWIWVDETGRRFVDESAFWSLSLTLPVTARERVWMVLPENELFFRIGGPEADILRAQLGSDAISCEATPDALAAAAGFDVVGFRATLDEVAAATATGVADATGRDPTTFPRLAGKLCHVPPGRIAMKNFGGLDVDEEGRVLDRDGAPIVGLYAVGEAAGMGDPGLGGQIGFDGSVAAVIWSGWRVGATLAGRGP